MSEDKYFLDTNILIYAYSKNEKEKRSTARRLLDDGPAVLSTQVLNEFIWVMVKKAGASHEDVEKILASLVQTNLIVDTGTQVILNALRISKETGYSHWDALIVAAGLYASCSIIYSEDMQHNRLIQGVRILNPFL